MPRTRLPLMLIALCGAPLASHAELYINEIFGDPGGGGHDLRDEFIELRGTPGMSLDNHYLIFVENENDASNTGPAGQIDNIFALGDDPSTPAVETPYTIGSNGFLVFRQGGHMGTPDSQGDAAGPSLYTSAPGTTDLINTGSGKGYGSGAGSSIRASDDADDGKLENGGWTAMIIRNLGDPVDNAPTIGFDLDEGNDGLDVPTGREDWEIIDAIGVHNEIREALYGRTYAQVNFGYERPGDSFFTPQGFVTFEEANLEPGAVYVGLGYETEYIARWGNSTGQTPEDWHISNLTDNSGSGSQGAPLDFRQSFTGNHGDLASGNPNVAPSQPQPGDDDFLESSQAVPYGTKLLDNVGAPNYITGDYNDDGVVDAADYTVWRDTLNTTGNESAHPAADNNHDFVVDSADYDLWAANFGSPNASPAPSASAAVPEPGAALLLLGAIGLVVARRR
ncbi:hypothetical protein MalM25_04230 [Planctomycetes bacterium MalM25]|nr:hypothetical protein MalM25_04230 [Planctomycetes bacterium MalM25]